MNTYARKVINSTRNYFHVFHFLHFISYHVSPILLQPSWGCLYIMPVHAPFKFSDNICYQLIYVFLVVDYNEFPKITPSKLAINTIVNQQQSAINIIIGVIFILLGTSVDHTSDTSGSQARQVCTAFTTAPHFSRTILWRSGNRRWPFVNGKV